VSRWVRRLLVSVVVAASAGAGVGAWLTVRGGDETLPLISVYSHGHTVRVGPFVYCNVVNLDDCRDPREQGEIRVTAEYPVQLSVPTAIGRAPWRLLRVYEDERNSTVAVYRPGTHLAVTIPAVDAQRGRLTGIAVQLLTLVRDSSGELRDVPHAEWSVRTVWR